ncbi:sulfur carrier protein ThiS [Lentilitoribacter sp. Alg239-R112]|uniref:sulfur carrier protein ThiS n=1 Tax=Lentilitoribacter sp. Alg239-R112 TaxID=2305987 RepID=UPI0013A6B656|nr:sulfur carrier protein ThiS [Lentilitoribacter sp. Alg239-R112]
MNILLNGEKKIVSSPNLTEALHELGYGDAKIATALNEEFIPENKRRDIVLDAGDRLEVLAPMQGG